MINEALYQKFHTLLCESKKTLLIAHKKPDGDTLGSVSSVFNYLLREGKNVRAFCLNRAPNHFSYIPSIEKFTSDQSVFEDEYDLVCIFDSGDLRYAGIDSLIGKIKSRPIIVNIDHHITNEHYGDLNIVHHDASSTADVVYRIFKSNSVYVDPHMATCLLTGIVSDTSSFVNSATNDIAMRIASELLGHGARLNEIISYLFKNKSVPVLQLWGRAFERIKENQELGIVSTVITENDIKETAVNDVDAVEGLANFLSAVLDTPTIMVLREMPDGKIKGSLRSVDKDVSEMAKLFGGGGHKKASGFVVSGKLVERDGIWQVEKIV